MRLRGFRYALALFLLPAALSLAGDVDDWSDAPAAWTAGLDLSAFCQPGEWTFDVNGEFAAASEGGVPAQLQGISAAAIFLNGTDDDEKVWVKHGPKFDELTSVRIIRGDEAGLVIEAFAGEVLAAKRKLARVTSSGLLWNRRRDAARCEPGVAPVVELTYYVDSWSGGSSVRRARIARAADGFLVVRLDSYTCWLCFGKNRQRQFARFRAIERRGAAAPGL